MADVELIKTELDRTRRLGKFIPASDPIQLGTKPANPRVTRDGPLVFSLDVPIQLRDGTILRGNIIQHETHLQNKAPVLFNYCVYGKDGALEIDSFPVGAGLETSRVSKHYLFEGADATWWCNRGYAVAIVDARGSFQSEGDKSYYSRDVGLDGYDVVEWLASQEWCNSKVAMYGASAYAMVQYLVAAERPPSLAAILPIDGMTDLYREMSMKGGIPETQFSSVYAHLYNWGHGLVEDAKDAITSHPYFDEYWQSKIPALERIECPVYIICGWGDHGIHTRGTLNAYYNINSKEKYLELHQYQKWEFAVSEESLSRQKAFLDRFLLGLSTEVLHWPKVRYTVRERFYVGDWRFASTFPLPNTTYTKMYPTMNKGLSLIALPNASSIAYDARKGKATFDFPVINPLEFVGHAKLKLWVEAKGAENMDLFVTLRKTDRHGNEVFFPWMTIIEDGPIAMGWLRVSRRELDQDRSKPWQPYHSHRRDLEPLKPGQIVPVEIEILPTSCKLRRGETLHVDISGHDYHENGYSKMIPLPRHTETVNQGEHIIHFGGQYDSHLYLPVLPPVSGSALESKKPVKMSLVARRVRGWTDEQFLSEYTGKHAEMTKAMASMVSVLRNYTQVVCCPPPRTERIKPSVYAPWDCMTTLAWSSLDGLWGSLQAPQYKASAGKHVFTDDESVGLLSESFIDFNFDPSQFLKRSSGYMVSLLLATSVSRETDELNLTEDLAARAETIKQVGAGTALLRYVLNRAITPPDPAGFFAGTPFSGFDWLTMGAMEQFWFPDLESINEFFRDTKRWETFQELPPSFNWDNSLLMIGKENVVVNKDLGI